MKIVLPALLLGLAACAETPTETAAVQQSAQSFGLTSTTGSTVRKVGNITVITGNIH